MLQRAEQCRSRLQAYCCDWLPEKGCSEDDYDLREDILSSEEWVGVKEVIKVLKPLLRYTKLIERRDVGLQDWIPIADTLITHFYECSQRFNSMADGNPIYEWLHICCETAWDKLNSYYGLIDKSPAYYTAVAMDPTLKHSWFEQRWTESPKREWVSEAKAAVDEQWKRWEKEWEKQPHAVIIPALQASGQAPVSQHGRQDDDADKFDENEHKRISYTSNSNANMFAQYCIGDAIEEFKLKDWKEYEKKQPLLVQFALDHSLPITTSECERSFSSAKFTLNPLRSCMKSDLFEALETLRAWFLQDHQERGSSDAEKKQMEELEAISKIFESESAA
jgi:hypothetical protein